MFAVAAVFPCARRLVVGRREMLIAASAAPRFRGHPFLIRINQIDENFAVFSGDGRALWHAQNNIFGVAARALISAAVIAAFRNILRTRFYIEQCIDLRVNLQKDMTTTTAVAAVWSAQRNIFFTAKTDAAIAAVASLNINFYIINKHKTLGEKARM